MMCKFIVLASVLLCACSEELVGGENCTVKNNDLGIEQFYITDSVKVDEKLVTAYLRSILSGLM